MHMEEALQTFALGFFECVYSTDVVVGKIMSSTSARGTAEKAANP